MFRRIFLEFYKVHNGQDSDSNLDGLIDSEVLLPFDRIVSSWETWKTLLERGELDDDEGKIMSVTRLAKGIKDCWWNVKWIPITSDGCGKHICIDNDPSQDGSVGQIIAVWSDIDSRELLSTSFTEWISGYVRKVEAGQYVYVSQFGVVGKDSVFAQED